MRSIQKKTNILICFVLFGLLSFLLMTSFFPSELQSPSWLCYCLKSTTSNATYVGQTKDFARRFREHKNKRRFSFVPLVCVEGLPTQRSAIQLERAWKKAPRKAGYKKWIKTNQITKRFTRIFDLFFVLNQEKWMKQAPPTSEFNLKIVCFDFVLAQNPIYIQLSSSPGKLNSLLIQNKSHFSIQDILIHYKKETKRKRVDVDSIEEKEKKDKKFDFYSCNKKIQKISNKAKATTQAEKDEQLIDLTI